MSSARAIACLYQLVWPWPQQPIIKKLRKVGPRKSRDMFAATLTMFAGPLQHKLMVPEYDPLDVFGENIDCSTRSATLSMATSRNQQ